MHACGRDTESDRWISMVMTPNSRPRHPAHSQTNISSFRWDFPLGVPDTANQKGPEGKSLYPFTSVHGSVIHSGTQARSLGVIINTPFPQTTYPHRVLQTLLLSISQIRTFPSPHQSCHAGAEDVITSLLSGQQSLLLWTGVTVPASLGGCEE